MMDKIEDIRRLREDIRVAMPPVNCETCYLHKPGTYTRQDCVTYGKRECALETVYIDRICQLIEASLEEYGDGTISTEKLAEKLGVNYHVLHGAFRRGCELFEPKADESRLLIREELDGHWEWVDEGDGYNKIQDWNIRTLIEDQDAKTARLVAAEKDAECQERVERIFREIATYQVADDDPYYAGLVIISKNDFQDLKKKEGVYETTED